METDEGKDGLQLHRLRTGLIVPPFPFRKVSASCGSPRLRLHCAYWSAPPGGSRGLSKERGAQVIAGNEVPDRTAVSRFRQRFEGLLRRCCDRVGGRCQTKRFLKKADRRVHLDQQDFERHALRRHTRGKMGANVHPQCGPARCKPSVRASSSASRYSSGVIRRDSSG